MSNIAITELDLAAAFFAGNNVAGDVVYECDDEVFVQCTGDGSDRHLYATEYTENKMKIVASYLRSANLILFYGYSRAFWNGDEVFEMVTNVAEAAGIVVVEVGSL